MKPGSWSATLNVSECNYVDPDGRVHCPSKSWMLVFALRRIGIRKIRERTPADADELVVNNYSQAAEGGRPLSPIESRKFLYSELSRLGSARLRRERPKRRSYPGRDASQDIVPPPRYESDRRTGGAWNEFEGLESD